MNVAESWENALYKMKKDELLSVVDEQDDYSPDLVAIAKEVLKQKYEVTEDDFPAFSDPDHLIEDAPMTRDLLLDVLREMECSIQFENDEDEDDGVCGFFFSYMNTSFNVYVTNDNVYVTVDGYCDSCKLQDEEGVARVKEAINVANEVERAKFYYLKDEESGCLFVNRCFRFLLIPLIPDIKLYLHHQFKSVISAEKYYNNVLEDLKKGKKRYENRLENCKRRMRKSNRRAGTKAVHRDWTEITGSLDLLLYTLDKMGFAYQIDEEDGLIRFDYYLDTFYAEADNNNPYVTLFYYSWSSIDLKDTEDVSATSDICKAINDSNWQNRVVTVFTVDEEEKTIDIHCKSEFLFVPGIPNLEDYLITELSNFFRAVSYVETGIIRR